MILIQKPADNFIHAPTIDVLLDLGYEITFTGFKDDEDGTWQCLLYYGDSAAPWKYGTIMGEGYGMTQQQAFNVAIANLKETIGYKKDGKETLYGETK